MDETGVIEQLALHNEAMNRVVTALERGPTAVERWMSFGASVVGAASGIGIVKLIVDWIGGK